MTHCSGVVMSHNFLIEEFMVARGRKELYKFSRYQYNIILWRCFFKSERGVKGVPAMSQCKPRGSCSVYFSSISNSVNWQM